MGKNNLRQFCHYYPLDDHDLRPYAEDFAKLEASFLINGDSMFFNSLCRQKVIDETIRDEPLMKDMLSNPQTPLATKALLIYYIWCGYEMCSGYHVREKDRIFTYNKWTKEEYDEIRKKEMDNGHHNGRYYPYLRYYQGEKKCPFKPGDPRVYYWELEEVWVNQVIDNEELSQNYLDEFMFDFPDILDNIDTKSPVMLRAFLYARYYDSGGRDKMGFYKMFLDYINPT